jgi:hypothetical protein
VDAGAVLLAADSAFLAGAWPAKAGIANANAEATNIPRLIGSGIIVGQTSYS